MRAIGLAGGPKKCADAAAELGYDVCLDHRSENLGDLIAMAAPEGADLYFENVGGKSLEATFPNLKTHARIALCGMIAWYSGADARACGLGGDSAAAAYGSGVHRL